MIGKEKYDEINVPKQLESVTQASINKAKHTKHPHFPVRSLSVIAACLALFILCNVPSIAANLQNVPVLGTLVQFLHVGSGGTVTDGVSAEVGAYNNIIRIRFTQDGTPNEMAPAFSVDEGTAPYRLNFTLHGVRDFNLDETLRNFKELPYVKDIYQTICLDDSAFQFTVELKQDADYQVSEYKKPGYVDLTLSPKKPKEPETVYFIRTASMDMDETLASFSEILANDGGTIVKTQNGKYCVVTNTYKTISEANNKLVALIKTHRDSVSLSIETCRSNENPK